jgi:hypothetical protein
MKRKRIYGAIVAGEFSSHERFVLFAIGNRCLAKPQILDVLRCEVGDNPELAEVIETEFRQAIASLRHKKILAYRVQDRTYSIVDPETWLDRPTLDLIDRIEASRVSSDADWRIGLELCAARAAAILRDKWIESQILLKSTSFREATGNRIECVKAAVLSLEGSTSRPKDVMAYLIWAAKDYAGKGLLIDVDHEWSKPPRAVGEKPTPSSLRQIAYYKATPIPEGNADAAKAATDMIRQATKEALRQRVSHGA